MGGGSTKDLRFSNGFVKQKSSTQIESQRKIIVSQRNIGGLYQQSQMNIVIEGDEEEGKKKEEHEFESLRNIITSQRNIVGLHHQSQMNIVIEGDEEKDEKKEEQEFRS